MNRKRIIICISVITVCLFTVLYFVFNAEKYNKIENNKSDIITYLSNNMIQYGNDLVKNENWFDTHKEINVNYINLYEIINNQNFDKEIFNYIDCDYSNTYLIINIDSTVSFDTSLDCVINKDNNGQYYTKKKLEEKLKQYGEKILESLDNFIEKDIKYLFNLKTIEEIYKMDLSMFKENYDFNETTLSIVISNYNNGKYDVNYETKLVLKKDKER